MDGLCEEIPGVERRAWQRRSVRKIEESHDGREQRFTVPYCAIFHA